MSKKIIQTDNNLIPLEKVSQRIFLVRGVKIMIDMDLAKIYGISVKKLTQSVKRNKDRFPADFMFQLDKHEFDSLRSQIVTSKGRGGRRYYPYVFSEHGVAMLSSVLRSKRAVQMNILIIRAFIKIREILASNKELAYKIEELEREQKLQNKHINTIYSMLERLISEPVKTKNPIGFTK